MPYKSATVAAAAAVEANADWTRVNVSDGTWTTEDPDSTVSNLSNVGGINKCTLDTSANSKIVDGCVFYKELKNNDGTSINYLDSPIDFRGYVHLPGVGWATNDGPSTGGDDRPPVASKVFCVLGLMSDPENLPTPRDVFGAGLDTGATVSRLQRQFVYNISEASPNGAISVSTSALAVIDEADVTAGIRSTNRLEFQISIVRDESLSGGALSPADPPQLKWAIWRARADTGDAYNAISSTVFSQKWARGNSDKMYVFVAVGRSGTVGTSQDLDFDCYYQFMCPEGGTNPSGDTALSGP
jgi:hypothetical protein